MDAAIALCHLCVLSEKDTMGAFCACLCDGHFSLIWLVGKIIIMSKGGSCSEFEIQC